MPKCRVLIVEDSGIAQQMLSEMIQTDPEIEVIGIASNGKEGVEKTLELKPDLVTMDLMMPVMSGQEAIDQIMQQCARPILVISSNNDSKVAFDACSRGALDIFPKDDLDPEQCEKLTRKIKLLSKVKVIGHIRPRTAVKPVAANNHSEAKVIAIACSTGGPKALSQMLPHLPDNYPHPVVVAQHIEEGFIEGLVEWLDQVCPQKLELGKSGMRLAPNTIYISPSEKNMRVAPGGVLEFQSRQEGDRYSPNCDVLLNSVADAYGPKSVGIILTGMATDGVAGIKHIRDKGGKTIAQDETTSVVYGMNRQAIESGYVDKVLPIEEIGQYLAKL